MKESPTETLVRKFKESFKAFFTSESHTLQNYENLNAYAVEFFPLHMNISLRGDRELLEEPDDWDGALYYDELCLKEGLFWWVYKYFAEVREKESYPQVQIWDQWVIICAVLAILSDEIQRTLLELKLPNTIMNLARTNWRTYAPHTFYVLGHDESGIPEDYYNYVYFYYTLKTQCGGKIDFQEIDRQYEGYTYLPV